MPSYQPPLAPVELHGAPAYYDNPYGPVSDTTSSSSIRVPLEGFADVPSRQPHCRLEALSAFFDSSARAGIIAAMVVDIFVYGTPLNAHFDRWICPFSNCKSGFSDPKEMILHAVQCTHVSPNGAYCNCCRKYYNFPGNGPAYRLSADQSLSPGVKTSTMAKSKKKIAGLISRCSGSSSRSQLPAVCQRSSSGISSGRDSMSESLPASRKGSMASYSGAAESTTGDRRGEVPAELSIDTFIVEIDDSPPSSNRSSHQSAVNGHTQQRSMQSSISTLSTLSATGYLESTGTDYGNVCMSPIDYSVADIPQNRATPTHDGGIPCAANDVAQHQLQTSLDPVQNSFWSQDQQQASGTWNCDGSAASSRASQGLPVAVPDLSLPLHNAPPRYGGDGGFTFHNPHHQIPVVSSVESETKYSSGDSFGFLHHQLLSYGSLDAGMAVNSMEPVDIADTNVESISRLPRLSAVSSASSACDLSGDPMRCRELGCKYQPSGAEAYRKANLNKHMKHMHGDRNTFPCERCGASFTRRDNLMAHQGGPCDRRKAQGHLFYRAGRNSRRRTAYRILARS